MMLSLSQMFPKSVMASNDALCLFEKFYAFEKIAFSC